MTYWIIATVFATESYLSDSNVCMWRSHMNKIVAIIISVLGFINPMFIYTCCYIEMSFVLHKRHLSPGDQQRAGQSFTIKTSRSTSSILENTSFMSCMKGRICPCKREDIHSGQESKAGSYNHCGKWVQWGCLGDSHNGDIDEEALQVNAYVGHVDKNKRTNIFSDKENKIRPEIASGQELDTSLTSGYLNEHLNRIASNQSDDPVPGTSSQLEGRNLRFQSIWLYNKSLISTYSSLSNRKDKAHKTLPSNKIVPESSSELVGDQNVSLNLRSKHRSRKRVKTTALTTIHEQDMLQNCQKGVIEDGLTMLKKSHGSVLRKTKQSEQVSAKIVINKKNHRSSTIKQKENIPDCPDKEKQACDSCKVRGACDICKVRGACDICMKKEEYEICKERGACDICKEKGVCDICKEKGACNICKEKGACVICMKKGACDICKENAPCEICKENEECDIFKERGECAICKDSGTCDICMEMGEYEISKERGEAKIFTICNSVREIENGQNTQRIKSISTKTQEIIWERDKQIHKTLTLNLIFFFLTIGPYMAVFILDSMTEIYISRIAYLVSEWFGYFNSAVNPLIYINSSKQLKKAIMETVKCRKWSNSVYPK